MAQAKARSSARKKSLSRASNGGPAASRSSSSDKSTVAAAGQKVAAPLSKVKGPAVAGAATAAGLVGGAVIGMKYAGRRKRVLGVPIPGTGNSLARQVGKAGKQAAELAREVRTAREKAEQVTKALT